MRRLPTLALVLLVLVSPRATALTFFEKEVTCPIGGERFRSKQMASGTSFCVRLDTKRLGAIASPPPLHVCPESKFAFDEDDFSRRELRSLEPWVESGEYQEELGHETQYYRLARTYERIARPQRDVAWHLLAASWEVDGEPERHHRYLSSAADAFERHLREIRFPERPLSTELDEMDLLLLVELRRRLGQFGQARELLDSLTASGLVNEMNREIAAYQSELVSAEDASFHYVPHERWSEEECSRLERSHWSKPAPKSEPSEAERRPE